ncbi:metallophosphoesterase [Pseudomonas sp. H9]|uniref:metallophosphoesterase n=1 Tax=Pseudomonas sp. H9 TaxID=483968 RepID=UPI00105832BC|nr:metallophosphoesterase [Pseudomonas sp. H9]TDF81207.1 phosphoprotein phosphatase [Pseudomonas sp. H9]
MVILNLIESPAVKYFSVNKLGRDFVVGDIHGCFDIFDLLLERVSFNYCYDRVFSVGDLIDRGPHSERVTDWLNKPWFHAVRGNHEQMAIDCIGGSGDIPRHTRNGGAWLYDMPKLAQLKIYSALSRLPVMIEIELSGARKIGIVHAEVPLLHDTHGWSEAKESISHAAGAQNQGSALKLALYSRSKIDNKNIAPVSGVEEVYVGHTTVPKVKKLGNVVYMDTGCSFGDGELSLIELNSGLIVSEAMLGR